MELLCPIWMDPLRRGKARWDWPFIIWPMTKVNLTTWFFFRSLDLKCRFWPKQNSKQLIHKVFTDRQTMFPHNTFCIHNKAYTFKVFVYFYPFTMQHRKAANKVNLYNLEFRILKVQEKKNINLLMEQMELKFLKICWSIFYIYVYFLLSYTAQPCSTLFSPLFSLFCFTTIKF